MKKSKIDLLIIILLIGAILTFSYDVYMHTRYQVVNGLYQIGSDTAIINMDRSWAEVMETCNHEFLHHKDVTHWEDDIND